MIYTHFLYRLCQLLLNILLTILSIKLLNKLTTNIEIYGATIGFKNDNKKLNITVIIANAVFPFIV